MCRVAAPGRLGFAYVISLGGPPGSVHLLHVAGVSLPGSVVREIWRPRSKVMTVRNVRKGHCLEWNLNSKPDTPRSGRSPIAVREASGALGFVVKGRLPFPLQIVWGFV